MTSVMTKKLYSVMLFTMPMLPC